MFIRHGTTTRIATKYDYDFINYDRKNNIPEYSLHISSSRVGYHAQLGPVNSIELTLNLTIENNGLRPVAINAVVLEIYLESDMEIFNSYLNKEATNNQHINVKNFIIQPATIENYSQLIFRSKKNFTLESFQNYSNIIPLIKEINAIVKINTGREIRVKVELI